MGFFVYADNAATTKLSQKAYFAMTPFLADNYGNPSGSYALARETATVVESAREVVSGCIGAQPNEIIFTSGGTESDNQAILSSLVFGLRAGRRHVITSRFEHHAVLKPIELLEKAGVCDVTYLDVYENGIVRVEDVEKAIRDDTCLVSVMTVNNELGTIQPIKEISALCKEKGVMSHTDAVQAAGHIPIDVKEIGVDFLSMSGHKFHGPKGVGVLYARYGVVEPYHFGGGQENGKRAGTENVPGILGLAIALEESCENMIDNYKKISTMRELLINGLLTIPGSHLNGDQEHRIPGTVNIHFDGVESSSLLMMLDASHICASAGSACTTGSLEPSHVLTSIGLTPEEAHSSIRFSIGEYNTISEMRYIVDETASAVKKLRGMSPT